MKALAAIQHELKAPKNQFNKFAKFHYRSCEGILESVKPLLTKHECTMVITDKIVEVGGRIYVEATVTLTDKDNVSVTACAYAREPESKKGMDDSQITGTASSYSRKYALNGLFLIDDTKDPDTDEHRQQGEGPAPKKNVNRVKAQAYTKELETMLEAEDGLGIRQLNDEIKDDETLWHHVWNYFTTAQKTKAKELMSQNKEEA